MHSHPTSIPSIAVAGLLAMLLFPQGRSTADAINTVEENCKSTHAALRRLEATINGGLEDLRIKRRNAEKMGEWYGLEEFGPYIDVLRYQERKLRAEIESIRRLTCLPGHGGTEKSSE